MKTNNNWREEFDMKFDKPHNQFTHLDKRKEKKDCQICGVSLKKNPKGYYKTFLTEQKCYWNSEMFEDVKSFIESLLSSKAEEIEEKMSYLTHYSRSKFSRDCSRNETEEEKSTEMIVVSECQEIIKNSLK